MDEWVGGNGRVSLRRCVDSRMSLVEFVAVEYVFRGV